MVSGQRFVKWMHNLTHTNFPSSRPNQYKPKEKKRVTYATPEAAQRCRTSDSCRRERSGIKLESVRGGCPRCGLPVILSWSAARSPNSLQPPACDRELAARAPVRSGKSLRSSRRRAHRGVIEFSTSQGGLQLLIASNLHITRRCKRRFYSLPVDHKLIQSCFPQVGPVSKVLQQPYPTTDLLLQPNGNGEYVDHSQIFHHQHFNQFNQF